MEIHVVQRGETIASIAAKYNVSEVKLIVDNGLHNPNSLVVGQCIVIVHPEITYTVKDGDTLESIATANNTTVIALYRNNPFLSNREYIYPGETLVISYGKKKGEITTNGYANPFINMNTLKKTLPYLTYLTIFGYQATANAEIIEPNDNQIIRISKEYHVAPIMALSALSYQGIGNIEAIYNILYNEVLVDKYIINILSILKKKGFYGVNVIYPYLFSKNVEVYNNFTKKISKRLNQEGFKVFISIPPVMVIKTDLLTFERIDYSVIGNESDQIQVMNYNWGHNFGPPLPAASIYMLHLFIDYLLTLVPAEKMSVGLPLFGYTWNLPYISGQSEAYSITIDAAINLANITGAEIQFDEVSQNPYYEYMEVISGVPKNYIVWFMDARTVDAFTKLVTEYELPGIAIWNIMSFYEQMWLIINSQYNIKTII